MNQYWPSKREVIRQIVASEPKVNPPRPGNEPNDSATAGAVPQATAVLDAAGPASRPAPYLDRRCCVGCDVRRKVEREMQHYMDSDRTAFLEGVRFGIQAMKEVEGK